MIDYPKEICFECGKAHGRKLDPNHLATCWFSTCDICGSEGTVTSPADFGFLKKWPIEATDQSTKRSKGEDTGARA